MVLLPVIVGMLLPASGITSLAYSRDAKHIVSGTAIGILRVSDPKSKTVAEIDVRTRIHSVAISSGGDFIAAAGANNSAFVWRLRKTLEPIWQAKLPGGDGSGVAFAFGGKRVAFTTQPNDHAYIYETGNGLLLQTLVALGNGMEDVAWLPDGKTLVTGGQCLMTWDLPNRRENNHPRNPKGAYSPFPAIVGWTRSLDVDAAGKYILAGSAASDEDRGQPRSVILVDSKSGKVARFLSRGGNEIVAVAISPDGRLAAASDVKNNVRIWTVADGSQLKVFQPGDESIHGLAFSPDGKRLATGGSSGIVRVWDL